MLLPSMALAWNLYKLKYELKSLLVRMGGWEVDKTKIRLSHLQTEVGVEVTTSPDGWVVGGGVLDKTKIILSHLQTEVGVEVTTCPHGWWVGGG